jgi:hypothetical protein
MGISTGQQAAGGTATTLCHVPAGPCDVVITNGGTAVVYLGIVTTGTVTPSNGMPLPSGGVMSFNGYQGSPGGNLQMVTTVGSATVGVLVSDSSGLAQPGAQ